MKRFYLPKRHFYKAINQSVNRRVGYEKEKCHHKYVLAKMNFANNLSKEVLIYANNEVSLTENHEVRKDSIIVCIVLKTHP